MDTDRKGVILTSIITTIVTLVVIGAGVWGFKEVFDKERPRGEKKYSDEYGDDYKYEDEIKKKNKDDEKEDDEEEDADGDKSDGEATGEKKNSDEKLKSRDADKSILDGVEWKKYSYAPLGFSFSYPELLKIDSDELSEGYGLMLLDREAEYLMGSKFALFFEEIETDFDNLDGFVKDKIKNKFPDQIYSAPVEIAVGDMRGLQLYDDRMKIDGIENSFGKNTYFLYNDKIYGFESFSFSEEVFREYEDVYDEILKTVEIGS